MRLKNMLAALVCAVTLIPSAAFAQGHDRWLADNANVLGEQERQQLRDASEATFQRTGVRVCVRTVASSNGEDVKHIAMTTLNGWNPGPRSVMLLFCADPRKCYLQPGTDLKYAFDESTATGICRSTIAPQFKQLNYYAGFLAGLNAVEARVANLPAERPAGQYATQQGPWTFLGLTAGTWFWIIVVLLVLIFLIWASSRSRGGYGGGDSWFFFSSSGGGDSSSSSSGGGWDFGGGGSCDGGGGGGSDC